MFPSWEHSQDTAIIVFQASFRVRHYGPKAPAVHWAFALQPWGLEMLFQLYPL